MPMRIGFFVAFLLLILAPRAALAEDYVCDDACRSLIYDWVIDDVTLHVPFNRQPAEQFESEKTRATCGVERGPEPKVHAIILAPLYPGYALTASTQNDANLLKSFFAERGVDPRFMTVLAGDTVTRDQMLAALTASLACVRERDQVVLAMSGQASSYDRWVAPSFNSLAGFMCLPEEKSDVLQAFCAAAEDLPGEARDIAETTYRQALTDHNEPVFFSSEVKVDLEQGRNAPDMTLAGLSALEIVNYVTQVRNRGADAFVVIEASYAAAFNLLELQRSAVPDGGWFWNTAQEDAPAAQDVNPELVALFGSGHFAAFYATADDQLASEVKVSDDDAPLGQLILSFTEVLRQEPNITLADLAKKVTASMKELGAEQNPIFAASSTTLRFMAPEAEAGASPQQIEIISPEPKRGAAAIEEKSFTLVARYSGTAKAFKAVVDGEIVNVDANGQFRQDIQDTGGKLAIQIRVLGLNFETLAASELKLREAEDQPVVATAARKLALIIANQTYGSGAFPPLKTPAADADAVVAVLTQRYGFATETRQRRPESEPQSQGCQQGTDPAGAVRAQAAADARGPVDRLLCWSW